MAAPALSFFDTVLKLLFVSVGFYAFLETDYNLDATAEVVQKAVHTVILIFLSNSPTYRRVRVLFLFQTKSLLHASSLWDAAIIV